MAEPEMTAVVDEKTRELLHRPTTDAWAACAAVWGRTLVLATPGWVKWPGWMANVEKALVEAVHVGIGASQPASRARQIFVLGSFEIEDDGSPEWQYVLDLTAMLLEPLQHDDLGASVRTTLLTYLEGTFNVLSLDLSLSLRRPISDAEAREILADDPTWIRTVAFVRSL